MLNKISWGSYLSAMVILLAVYYIFIVVKFYWQELRGFIISSTGRYTISSSSDDYISNYIEDILQNCTDQNEKAQAAGLCNSLSSAVLQAVNKKTVKEELMMSLQLIVHQFFSLKQSSVKFLIDQFVIDLCQKYCSVHLNNEEVGMLWDGGMDRAPFY